MKNFQAETQLDMYEADLHDAAKGICKSIELLRLGASCINEMEARERAARDSEIQSISYATVCIYASYACLLRGDRALKLKLPNAQNECVITQTVCDRNNTKVKQLMQFIDDGPVKNFEKYHEYVAHQQLCNNFPQHPLTRLF